MKLPVVQIPDEGMERELRLPASALRRLEQVFGAQDGTLEAAVRLKNREGSILVEGTLRFSLAVPCQRCLEPVRMELDEPFAAILAPQSRLDELEVDLQLSAGDLEVSFYEGEAIDLVAVLEEEVLLLVPETICEEDSEGRCIQCGKNVDEILRRPDGDDHPFAQLKEFLKESETKKPKGG